MSKLYHTESGHAIPTLAEELTTFRRARKSLYLETTTSPGVLYIMARAWPDSKLPLRVGVNGTEISPVEPEKEAHWWYTVGVDAALLNAGENTIDLWCDSKPMNAWSLAIEPGHAYPRSFISDDGGETWRNDHMGYLNTFRGEYLVRMRLAEGEDPLPPPMCSAIQSTALGITARHPAGRRPRRRSCSSSPRPSSTPSLNTALG